MTLVSGFAWPANALGLRALKKIMTNAAISNPNKCRGGGWRGRRRITVIKFCADGLAKPRTISPVLPRRHFGSERAAAATAVSAAPSTTVTMVGLRNSREQRVFMICFFRFAEE